MGSRTNSVDASRSPLQSSSSSAAVLQPTWYGFVYDTREALQLFESVLVGQLQRVIRRPHDRERAALIRSGSVFIYEENASGIKRWTDGLPWSPSRILGNFLIYRELEKPFPPGEKKRASKKPKRPSVGEFSPSDSDGTLMSPTSPSTPISPSFRDGDRETERSLIGSLTDSYAFRDGGLVKKTISVVVDDIHLHLVSYYNPEDVKANQLQRVSSSPYGRISPRQQLLHRQNFRAPVDESEEAMQQQNMYALTGMRGSYVPSQPGYIPQSNYISQSGYSMQASAHSFQQVPQQGIYGEQQRYTVSPHSPSGFPSYYSPPPTLGHPGGLQGRSDYPQHPHHDQQQQQQPPPPPPHHHHHQQPTMQGGMPYTQYPSQQDGRHYHGQDQYGNPQHPWSHGH